MHFHTNGFGSYIESWHMCKTCHQIWEKHFQYLTGGTGDYYQGDVDMLIFDHPTATTPEELLQWLDNQSAQ